jgi:hypothetical protein
MAESANRGDQEIALELTKMAASIIPVNSHDALLDLYKKCVNVVSESGTRTDKTRQF